MKTQLMTLILMLIAFPVVAQRQKSPAGAQEQKASNQDVFQVQVYKAHSVRWKNTTGYHVLAETSSTRYTLECAQLNRFTDGTPMPCRSASPGQYDAVRFDDAVAIYRKWPERPIAIYFVTKEEEITSESEFSKKLAREVWW